jgi:hypothetical protein
VRLLPLLRRQRLENPAVAGGGFFSPPRVAVEGRRARWKGGRGDSPDGSVLSMDHEELDFVHLFLNVYRSFCGAEMVPFLAVGLEGFLAERKR